MSIATGYLALIPSDWSFVPVRGTARRVAERLSHLCSVNEPSQPEQRSFVMYPHEPCVELMRFGGGYAPFSIVVREFDTPTGVFDDVALRQCRACGNVVHTWAECESCGVEEDPSTWQIGPSKLLYSRAFELQLVTEKGPDIWPQPDAEVEAAVRAYFGNIVSGLEAEFAMPMTFVRHVGP